MKGIKKELAELFETDYNRLVKRASFRVGGSMWAEDVVQEAFYRALKYARGFDPTKKDLPTWVNTILNNAAKDIKQENRREGMGVDTDMYDDPFNIVFKQEMVKKIHEEIESERKDTAEVLKLYVVLGFTAKETEQMTSLAARTVRQYGYEFCRRMRAKYGEEVAV